MAAKKRGVEPCYETALSLAPRATLNDATGARFSRLTVNEVLTTDCYESDTSRPWEFRFGAKRRALLDEDKAARRDWAERLLSEGHTAAWYRDNVVWVDICAKVIPGSPSKALDQKMAAKNKKKRLISPGSTASSVNLGGSSTADKQCGFGDTRVCFLRGAHPRRPRHQGVLHAGCLSWRNPQGRRAVGETLTSATEDDAWVGSKATTNDFL